MSRSQFVWLIVFDTGKTQFIKAQTIWQILNCEELDDDSDSIINITRMELSSSCNYEKAIEVPFED